MSYDRSDGFLQGKRTWDETYEKPPKYNSYLEPWYDDYIECSTGNIGTELTF